MAKKWREVVNSPAYLALDPQQREAAREAYFENVVAPHLKTPEELDAARAAFEHDTAPRVQPINVDPLSGMSTAEKVLAGYGKAGHDIVQGLGELGGDALRAIGAGGLAKRLNLPTAADVAAEQARDAPLMSSRAGWWSNLGGNVLDYVPLAAIPGADTVAGAGLIGGGVGAAAPTTGGWASRARNAMTSALLSGSITAGVRALPTLGGALVKPFTRGGRNSLALDVLNKFAENPDWAQNIGDAEILPGSRRSLAEATRDRGLAQLERTATTDPRIANIVSKLRASRLAARRAALEDLKGSPGQKDFYEAERNATAQDLYNRAYDTPIDLTRDPETGKFRTKSQIAGIKGEITKLLRRPSIRKAIGEARSLAADEGVKIGDPAGSVLGLDYVKRALDDQIENSVGNKRRVYQGLKNRLLTTLDNLSSDYKAARNVYSDMSKPINRMEIGEYLHKKLIPALSEYGAERQRPQALAQALQEGDAMARKALGFKGAKLDQILTEDDINMLHNLGLDLGSEAWAQDAGAVRNSATAQYLAGRNMMRQILGPLGMPNKWTEGILSSGIGRTLGDWTSHFPFNIAEHDIQARLGELLTDPEAARQAAAEEAARRASIGARLNAMTRLVPMASLPAAGIAAQGQ